MPISGGNGRDDPERKKRIEELERQAGELTGGEARHFACRCGEIHRRT